MKKIFLVEDDAEICDIINEYFGNKGVEVAAVQNGGEALDMIAEGLTDIDLVLLDIMLPEIDGFTLCRQLRRRSSRYSAICSSTRTGQSRATTSSTGRGASTTSAATACGYRLTVNCRDKKFTAALEF
nr:response regulator [Ruminococcus flavefaciens]